VTRDEMREAAEQIGLTHRGRPADLLGVYPERGTARIVAAGFSIEIPVAELSWHTEIADAR
jgi:hypothetical protein